MSSTQSPVLPKKGLSLAIALSLYGLSVPVFATQAFEFNTDVLDLEDKNNIDLNQFARAGYIMPGTYSFTLKVNDEQLPEVSIPFYVSENDAEGSIPCLSPEVTSQLGLQSNIQKEATFWHEGQCLSVDSVPGMQVRGDLATSSLYVSIPQAYLEYTAPNWDPPSRWDEGIAALKVLQH